MISWSGFFFYWYIKLLGLFSAKSIFLEEQLGYYLIFNSENLVTRLKFELAYYIVQHVNNQFPGTLSCKRKKIKKKKEKVKERKRKRRN